MLLAVSVIACGIFDGCSLSNNSWFLRKYQNTAPHDRAVLERQDKILEVEWILEVECVDGFQQIIRTGSAVCYHDNMGGRECYTICYTIIRERAK
jgi:hypothetical protein